MYLKTLLFILFWILGCVSVQASSDAWIICQISSSNSLWASKYCDSCSNPCKNCSACECDLNQRVISLELADITSFPISIASLSFLSSLTIRSSQLSIIPSFISGLTTLEHLDLHENQILEIPSTIPTNLHHLKTLSLGYNNLSIIPDSIGNLISLTQLTLENNVIKTLPATLSNLVNLTYLDVSFNRLRTLCRNLADLTNLEYLYANDNFIAVIVEDMLPDSEISACDFSMNCMSDDFILENHTCVSTFRPDCNATSDPIPDLFSSDDDNNNQQIFKSSSLTALSSSNHLFISEASSILSLMFFIALI